MSAQPNPPADGTIDQCPVCGTPVAQIVDRCPECGYDLAGMGIRPGAYSRTALAWTIALFTAVYLVILAAVALAN